MLMRDYQIILEFSLPCSPAKAEQQAKTYCFQSLQEKAVNQCFIDLE